MSRRSVSYQTLRRFGRIALPSLAVFLVAACTNTEMAADEPLQTVAAKPNLHPHEGSGIVGSPEMIKLSAEWAVMNDSAPKDRGRKRFTENKYGMFIHWGLYAQPGGVWKGKRAEDGGNGPSLGEWIMRRKEIPRSEYAELATTFNPVNFDADEWVAVAKAAGMKYMVITSKHHDGFALFDSDVSDYNVVDGTPFGRDLIAELETACKKAGLAFGVYYSQSLDWRDGGDGGWADYQPANAPQGRKRMPNQWDPSPTSFDDYIANKSLPQVQELVNNYDLSQIWFDTPIFIPPKYSMAFYKTVYNANPEILVNQRIGNGFGDIGIPGDNVIPSEKSANTWEGIATTNHSWGYKSYDNDWKSPAETMFWLIENVSKGGNFLLNVGPDGSGTIPAQSVENLLAVGEWLKVYGDAVYGTRAWDTSKEGPTNIDMRKARREKIKPSFEFTPEDFWFTTKDDSVYAIAMAFPDGNRVRMSSLADYPVASIELVRGAGSVLPVSWDKRSDYIEVTLPGDINRDALGYALKVNLK
ncbi:MAG: alpha-L-fucosidase [Litorimonas sp.]